MGVTAVSARVNTLLSVSLGLVGLPVDMREYEVPNKPNTPKSSTEIAQLK